MDSWEASYFHKERTTYLYNYDTHFCGHKNFPKRSTLKRFIIPLALDGFEPSISRTSGECIARLCYSTIVALSLDINKKINLYILNVCFYGHKNFSKNPTLDQTSLDQLTSFVQNSI